MNNFRLTPFVAAIAAAAALNLPHAAWAQSLSSKTIDALKQQVERVQPKMVEWRRHIHENAELSGQEVKTAAYVAKHLRALGYEVREGVGGTGVVGVLKGARPGRTVALRADMDALPVAEASGLPFASRQRQPYMGTEVPVAHACGHDGHTAMLMGAAEVFAGMRDHISGTIVLVFQPAEEGASHELKEGEKFGAAAMIADGALQPKPDAIFAAHLIPNMPRVIAYKTGPVFASSDVVKIRIKGKQTHGAMPWHGVDAISVGSQLVNSMQTIVSRQLDISKEPAVLSIGKFIGGNRNNIIPESVELEGTLRTFDEAMRRDAKARIRKMATLIAEANGATAEVSFPPGGYSATINPEALMNAMVPVLTKVSDGKIMSASKLMASEDFSEFQKEIPGVYILVGAPPVGKDPATAAPNHNPAFDFDEGMMQQGTKAMAGMALEFLSRQGD
ncbi:amidohydrolase [Malikia granosa]|nr:amidohydrolase [Malikia granosa]